MISMLSPEYRSLFNIQTMHMACEAEFLFTNGGVARTFLVGHKLTPLQPQYTWIQITDIGLSPVFNRKPQKQKTKNR